MYQIDECWDEFYAELDPDRRREIYGAVTKDHPDDGANAFRLKLMDKRYTDPRKKGHKVDNFIWQIMILPGFRRPIYLIPKVADRDLKAVIHDLALDEAEDWDEAKRTAAYWEYRNAGSRYLTTCTGPNYAKKVFGIMQSNDEEKLVRTARDFYMMTVKVPRKYGRQKELAIFTQAMEDAFRSSSPAANTAWRREAALDEA